MAADPGGALAPLRNDPESAGILVDYDGTLAPIVSDPSAAEPVTGSPELLDRLARRYRVVAVVSGRPLAFLAPRFPPSIVLSGLYGLEAQRHGERRVEPEAEPWAATVAEAVAQSRAKAPPGVLVEDKGLSLTVHYRTDPSLEARVRALADEIAASAGLVVHVARMSVELRPPVQTDKGTVVKELAEGLDAVCYLGDDIGDIPAFRALDDLGASGVAVVRVAVRSNEAPPALLNASDITVDGPAGVVELLQSLL